LIIPAIPYKLKPENIKDYIISQLNAFGIEIINEMPDFYQSMRKIVNDQIPNY
jgi:hypothetical protein